MMMLAETCIVGGTMDGYSHPGIAEREDIMVRWKGHEGLVPTDLKHAEDGSRRSGTDRCLAYMQALGLSELTVVHDRIFGLNRVSVAVPHLCRRYLRPCSTPVFRFGIRCRSPACETGDST